MKIMTNCLLMILLGGLLAVAGCGKSSKPPPSSAAGLMDMAPLQQAFPSPAPEVQASLEKFRMAIRYGQFEPALVELDKLAQLPDLTEAQKKAVNDKIEQVKQRLSSAAKPPQ